MFRRVRQLLEMIRFSHTLFALPFALLAALMAWTANARAIPPTPFRWLDLVGILVCMACARSAAMSFNRLADHRWDALNPRTEDRHLPREILSRHTVLLFTLLCSVGFMGGTLLFLPQNPIPLYASFPVLLFLFGYSYSKHWTMLTHFWLGAALMLAPVAAWVALRPVFSWAPMVLGLAVLFWVAGFDIIYACQDYEFDVRMRLRSVPARFGVAAALRIAAACHAVTVGLLFLLPQVYPAFGKIYLGGVIAIAGLLLYEHWLVRPD
ncbi:MAG: UbiA family prenyltransferase, partial [Pirellulales bacterium]|nr:UbiA family prenyltransferase [Pirellulales bacterium]